MEIERIDGAASAEGEGRGIVRRLHNYLEPQFLAHIRPLLNEGLIEIRDQEWSPEQVQLENKLRRVLEDNQDILVASSGGPRGEMHVQLSEFGMGEVHEQLVGPLRPGSMFHFGAICTYYAGLLADMMRATLLGQQVISPSRPLREMLLKVDKQQLPAVLRNETLKDCSPRFAFDVLEAMLLDVGDLTIEDILEVRVKLRDELVAFRSELARLEFEFEKEFEPERLATDGQRIARARLAPRLTDLERRIEDSKLSVLKNLLKTLQKPDAYLPMVGTSFAGLPLEWALMVSLGVVSGEVALEWWQARKRDRADGLFYLMKLRERGTGDAQSRSPFGSAEQPKRDYSGRMDFALGSWTEKVAAPFEDERKGTG
jgi:hypothetical protein